MIGHSFPTLEELPYILIMLDNRTNSCRMRDSLKGPTGTTRNGSPGRGDFRQRPVPGVLPNMTQTSSLRQVAGRRGRLRFARISVCLLGTSLVLALAILAGLSSGPASAQATPTPPPQVGA